MTEYKTIQNDESMKHKTIFNVFDKDGGREDILSLFH